MNQIFQSIVILATAATTVGIFFIFTTTSSSNHQTFAQDNLTIKETLEQTFGKENGKEASINQQMNENGKTGFAMEDLYPEEKLAKDLANKTLSEETKKVVKAMIEDSPEFKAKQALTIKYNELQEKYYLECAVNKESGQFKDTIDCKTWSEDTAQIQLGLK